VNILFPSDLKSHTDRLLNDHLVGVQSKGLKLFDTLDFDFPCFKREDLREVVSVAALYHDFGKATSFFQDYINNPEQPSTDDSRNKRNHGLISAIKTFLVLKEKFGVGSVLPAFGFIIVRKHHGNLDDYRSLLTITDTDLENCKIQAKDLEFEEFKNFDYGELRSLRRKDRGFEIEHYFVLNLLYSIILQADKTDAIMKDDSPNKGNGLKSNDVTLFKNGFTNEKANSINSVREDAFQSVKENIDKLDKHEKILSINIPTGSGKTISSLYAALMLCEKFGYNHIVYCLPFTSVIDQNYQVFDEIRKNAELSDDSGILMKHHHLTDINYKKVDEEHVVKEYTPNQALHLIEGWESNLIVTTFVQFMYTLISYKNSSLRKFNRLSNAVIILDEIQSVPHEYWELVRVMLKEMSERLNSTVILVTATMPLIFSEENAEIKELITEKKKMFGSLNRIELDVTNLKKEQMVWEGFIESAKNLVDTNTQKNILFVMNTIRSAKDLLHSFERITTHHLLYLSSHIIPKDRLKRIMKIKNKDGKKPILVVSTQMVEAGVDIDLDIVIRDFAPLDSIFQTCGRCNRECREGIKGKVILYSLKDSNKWTPAGIYKSFLKQKTIKVLQNKEIIPESEFYHLANDYFNEVKIGGSQTDSITMLDKIKKLKYQGSDKTVELNLIDNDYTATIFVELDKNAQTLWLQYKETQEMVNGFEKNVALKQIQRRLSDYIINIPKKCLPTDHDNGIYHLRNERVSEYYDDETGFNPSKQLPPEESSLIF